MTRGADEPWRDDLGGRSSGDDPVPMTLSRRSLIHLVGKAGGVAAAYHTMAAMGLLAVPAAYAGPPALPPGRGRRVVIIGAGIAGMVLAYELRKAGYQPLVLEARARPGGRNWSLRGGDTVVETGSTQHVAWDRGEQLYFNPGPARLPYHHEGILAYCRALGVPLEVMCNDNRGALMQDDAGVRRRAAAQPAGGQRRARLCRGAGGEGGGQGPAGAAGQRRGQGTAARVPAQFRRAGPGPCVSRLVARRLGGAAGRHAARHADISRWICGRSWLPISGAGRCSSANSRPWRRRCCNRWAAWAASARRSGARCAASSPTRRW